jgi:hypothetical protein
VKILADQKNAVNNVEAKINKELYDLDRKDDFSKDIKDIELALSRINKGHNRFTGSNLIEYLNKMEFNTNNLDITNALKEQQGKKKVDKSAIEGMLSKDNLSQLIDFEKDRFSRYDDYNLIYSYIPQLAECINVFRDSILSPDDLTKSSLNVYYKNNLAKADISNDVINNLNKLVSKYDLNTKAKNIIRKTLTMGDYFVAVLKYDDEFNKMLLNENKSDLFIENVDEETEEPFQLLAEHIEIDAEFKEFARVIKEGKKDGDMAEVSNLYSNLQKDVARVLNDNISYEDDPRKMLIASSSKDFNKLNRTRQKRKGDSGEYVDFGIKGSIVRMLDPQNVIKLEVDGINFGYIYIEKAHDTTAKNSSNTAISDFFNSRVDIERSKFKDREDVISGLFLKGISKKIDNELIKDNKEFKDYLYTLLKEKYITEKSVKITYLTPDEVVHFMTDSDELYGQSKLSRSLFFAKLYLATLITELMQKISRGRDKRLVYVETGLDDDIEGVIQGVVKDIKSKEIQTDVLKSITTILNSIGVFDDYYIPLVDGEKPLDFDTLQGMDVDADNDFLQFLLKSAIGGTGVPVNYIDATQDVDFARSLAMQNSTFVRTVVSDQQSFSASFSLLMRMLYRNEYLDTRRNPSDKEDAKNNGKQKASTEATNVDLDDISVLFPPPITLNLNNINDQISNSSQTLDFVTSVYIDETEADPTKKLNFRKKVVRKLIKTIDWDEMDALFEESEMDSAEDSLKKSNNDGDLTDDEDMGGMSGF